MCVCVVGVFERGGVSSALPLRGWCLCQMSCWTDVSERCKLALCSSVRKTHTTHLDTHTLIQTLHTWTHTHTLIQTRSLTLTCSSLYSHTWKGNSELHEKDPPLNIDQEKKTPMQIFLNPCMMIFYTTMWSATQRREAWVCKLTYCVHYCFELFHWIPTWRPSFLYTYRPLYNGSKYNWLQSVLPPEDHNRGGWVGRS